MNEPARSLYPVTLLTGFLGSGKTTLLRRLLATPGLSDSAVLINEIGAVGVDHHLVRELREDVVVLPNGCLCCTVRSDLVDALRELLFGRGRKGIARFSRVFIETSGLADPAPVAQALVRDPLVMQHFRLDSMITVVDAAHGMRQLERHREAVRQVAIADRLVLSKTDITRVAHDETLINRLRAINPTATLFNANTEGLRLESILEDGLDETLRVPVRASRWLAVERDSRAIRGRAGDPAAARHDDQIKSFVVRLEGAPSMDLLRKAFERLLAECGESPLRIKGLLAIEGMAQPMVLHAVQHVMSPMFRLSAWPDGLRESLLVFVADGLDPQQVIDRLSGTLGTGVSRG